MDAFLSFLANLTLDKAFSVGLTVILAFILLKAIHGLDLAEMFESHGSGKISHTKFWSNVAYLVGTISFIKINFSEHPPEYLPELWLFFLGVIGGNSAVSKWISLKYQNNKGRYDDDDYYGRGRSYSMWRDENVNGGEGADKEAEDEAIQKALARSMGNKEAGD
nr:MAG TPA: Protein of unknown function (DUF2644) [Caudoviricetes sp.]